MFTRAVKRPGTPTIVLALMCVAMAMVGQKTEEVYRRYAIGDEAMPSCSATQ
jgi:hypothetical protein